MGVDCVKNIVGHFVECTKVIGAICNGIKLLEKLGNGGRRRGKEKIMALNTKTPHFHEFQQCHYQKE
jgi:hypothetical protein